LMLETCRGE